MNRERKTDPVPEVPTSDENAVKETTGPWWKEHPSSATVLLIAGATSALYFFGSKRLDKLAAEFGLAGPPRSMGLQEVMVAGVDVFQLPVLLILFAAAVLLVLVLKLVIWVHEYASKGQDALIEGVNAQQEKAAALRQRDEITDDELAELERDLSALVSRVSRNSKLRKASRYALKFGKVFRVVLASVTLSLVMASGVMTGKLDAWLIRTAVAGECEGCSIYVTSRESIVAYPIFQADDKIIAFRKGGTIIIPMTPDLIIKKFTPQPKKAGSRGGTD
ncbi:hypothetical protein ACVENA_16185 [Sphingopyxis sp. 550A]